MLSEDRICFSCKTENSEKLKQKHGIRKKPDFIWPYFIRSNPNILYPTLWRLWGEKYLKMSLLWWFCIWIRLYIKLHSDRKPCWLASGGNGLWRTPKFLTQDTVFIWLSKKRKHFEESFNTKKVQCDTEYAWDPWNGVTRKEDGKIRKRVAMNNKTQ